MATTAVDEKLKIYSGIQAGIVHIEFFWGYAHFYCFEHTDIQSLFVQKQQALSQFNENTLVKGVREILNARMI